MTTTRASAAALACGLLLTTASQSIAQQARCARLPDPFTTARPDDTHRANPWGSPNSSSARIAPTANHFPLCWKRNECRVPEEFGEILNAYYVAWVVRLNRDVEIRFEHEATGRCWLAAREGPQGTDPVPMPAGMYRVNLDAPPYHAIEMRIRIGDDTRYGPVSRPYEIASARYVLTALDELATPLNTEITDTATFVGWLPRAESVTVRGVDAGAPAIGARIPGTALERPLANGRTLQSIIPLVPGLTVTESTGTLGQFTAVGARRNQNRLTVDGISADLGVSIGSPGIGEGGSQAQPAIATSGGTQTLVPAAAINEIEVRTAAVQPRYAQTSGAHTRVVTRSGANAPSGSVFGDFRAFASRELGLLHSGKRVPQIFANAGISAGGPALPDRAFFFVAAEHQYLNRPYHVTINVPAEYNEQFRNGDRPAILEPPGYDGTLGTLPAAHAYLTRLAILDQFPILHHSTPYYTNDLDRVSNLSTLSVRTDTNITIGHRAFLRMNAGGSKGRLYLFRHSPSSRNTERTNTRTLTAGLSSTFRRTLVNELRLNVSRHRGQLLSEGFQDTNWGNDERWVRFDVLPGAGGAIIDGRSADTTQEQHQLTNTVTIVRGRNEWRAGLDVSRAIADSAPAPNRYTYSFTGPLQIVDGQVRQILSERVQPATAVFRSFALFAEHTIALSPGLSINYGARWSRTPPPASGNNIEPQLLRYDALPAIERLPLGSRLWKTSTNFAPRLGVSYQLRPSTIISASWSAVYDELSRPGAAVYGRGFPYIQRAIFRPSSFYYLDDQAPELAVPDGSELLAEYYAFSDDLRPSRTYQWYVGVEQELQRAGRIRVAYVGTAARDLVYWSSAAIHNPIPQTVQMYSNNGRADYRALLVSHTRPLAGGFEMSAQYAWSRARDTDSGDTLIPNPPPYLLAPAENFARADFDRPHALRIESTYQVPGKGWLLSDWQLAAAVVARSGAAFTVTSTRALGSSFYALRPDVVPGVDLWIDDATSPTGRRVNRAAFAAPSTPQNGSLDRNALRASPLRQLDLSVARSLRCTGLMTGATLEFRLTGFNVFNVANVGPPVSDLDRGDFGVPDRSAAQAFGTGTLLGGGLTPVQQDGAARVLQFGVRLAW